MIPHFTSVFCCFQVNFGGGRLNKAFSCSVLIENLPPEADGAWLDKHFAEYGTITSRNVNPARSQALVLFQKLSSSKDAIQNARMKKFDDRILHVSSCRLALEAGTLNN